MAILTYTLILAATLSCVIHSEASKNEWDLLVFTQLWPVIDCKEWKEKDESHNCRMPANQFSWTVHGIWPTKLGEMGPQFCNRSWHFDPEQIRPIESRLMQLWTNVEDGTPIYEFWIHEWTKHGTCAAILQSLNSEFKYFSKGLELIQQYTMTNILKKFNIIPSSNTKYLINDIYNAVKSTLGINPIIKCVNIEGVDYLSDLRICLDKNLHLSDCDGVKQEDLSDTITIEENSILSNCDKTKGIVYLPRQSSHDDQNPPNLFYVQIYKFISWLQWFTL